MSRTPVIDALKRLASDGLVEIRARRGCFVRELTAADIREIFEIREATELFAIRQVVRAGRYLALAAELEAAEIEMERHIEGDAYADYDRFIHWDQVFHRSIVAAAGNARLSEIYANLHVHLHIIRSHNLDVLRAGSQVASDHRLILEAIRAGDADAAEEAAYRHLAPIRDKMVANLQREQSQA